MVNFQEVEQGIFKEIGNKGLKVDEWDLKKIFEDSKSQFISEQVKELNIYQIENHDLLNGYSEIRKRLNSINDSEEIKQIIKSFFSKFSKEDRIKQLLDKLPLDVGKILNKGNDRFYSLYDISKDYSKEQAIKQIKESCKKEVLISCYLKDSYRVGEQLRYLEQLLNYFADETEGYSGADIAGICAEAGERRAWQAVKEKQIYPITMDILLDVIHKTNPSVSKKEMEWFREFEQKRD